MDDENEINVIEIYCEGVKKDVRIYSVYINQPH